MWPGAFYRNIQQNMSFVHFMFSTGHTYHPCHHSNHDSFLQSQAKKCAIELGTIPLTTIEKLNDVSLQVLPLCLLCQPRVIYDCVID
jgi:hypothetical protein